MINELFPLIIFYIILLINTVFSVRCFSRIIPRGDWMQRFVDAVLLAHYACLAAIAAFFPSPLLFLLVATLLFAIASIKYALLLGQVSHLNLLRRKIYVDALGATACLLCLVALLLLPRENHHIILWTWTLLFAVANIYFFFINPLYPSRVEERPAGDAISH